MNKSSTSLDAYQGASLSTRLHIRIRWKIFPFLQLIPFIPTRGVFLDVGCGFGLWSLYLAQHFPSAQIIGIDPDNKKIDVAKQAAINAGVNNLDFKIGPAGAVNIPRCSLVSVIDVMYLVPYSDQEDFLLAVVNNLDRGGRLLLKDMSERPRWKFAWNWVEEWLMVRLLGFTQGNQFFFRRQSAWEGLLRDMGLVVRTLRMDRHYLHPHILYVCEKM